MGNISFNNTDILVEKGHQDVIFSGKKDLINGEVYYEMHSKYSLWVTRVWGVDSKKAKTVEHGSIADACMYLKYTIGELV